MKKSRGCGENTVKVSGADGTEPAAREEEGRWDGPDTVLRARFQNPHLQRSSFHTVNATKT